jgi:hypothetical protein
MERAALGPPFDFEEKRPEFDRKIFPTGEAEQTQRVHGD